MNGEGSFYLFMLLGLLGMIISMLYVGGIYGVEKKKTIITAVFITVVGLIGTHAMSFIESGYWGGMSFYGAVFLIPVLMCPMAKILKVGYGDLMDMCSPAGCLMLAVLKIKCRIEGCCRGKLFTFSTSQFRFPSQIVECIFALVLMMVLLRIIAKGKHRGMVYPICLIMYGTGRFFLNLLRYTEPWIGPLSTGCVWSLISIAIGTSVLISNKRKVQIQEHDSL